MPPSGKTSSGEEIIRATVDLRKKVREIPIRSPEDDPVRRAEAALEVLSKHFDDWMEDEVATIARRYCGRSRMIAQASSNCLGAE